MWIIFYPHSMRVKLFKSSLLQKQPLTIKILLCTQLKPIQYTIKYIFINAFIDNLARMAKHGCCFANISIGKFMDTRKKRHGPYQPSLDAMQYFSALKFSHLYFEFLFTFGLFWGDAWHHHIWLSKLFMFSCLTQHYITRLTSKLNACIRL